MTPPLLLLPWERRLACSQAPTRAGGLGRSSGQNPRVTREHRYPLPRWSQEVRATKPRVPVPVTASTAPPIPPKVVRPRRRSSCNAWSPSTPNVRPRSAVASSAGCAPTSSTPAVAPPSWARRKSPPPRPPPAAPNRTGPRPCPSNFRPNAPRSPPAAARSAPPTWPRASPAPPAPGFLETLATLGHARRLDDGRYLTS